MQQDATLVDPRERRCGITYGPFRSLIKAKVFPAGSLLGRVVIPFNTWLGLVSGSLHTPVGLQAAPLGPHAAPRSLVVHCSALARMNPIIGWNLCEVLQETMYHGCGESMYHKMSVCLLALLLFLLVACFAACLLVDFGAWTQALNASHRPADKTALNLYSNI